MSQKQVGIIDVGSNTIKLLIAECSDNKQIRETRFEIEETRIGEGITGNPPNIDETAIRKGTLAIARLHSLAREHNLDALRIVATSAVRDAANRISFIESVREETGATIEILSGDEEARLIGKGIQCDPELSHLKNYSLLDLGGGSMECIQFIDQQVSISRSLDLGAVRLTSEHISDRYAPISSQEAQAIQTRVKNSLVEAGINAHENSTHAVLTGGTATIIAERLRSRGMSLSEATLFRDQVCRSTHQDRIDQLNIPESRADIFPAATTILCEALDHLNCDTLYFSQYNLRYGLGVEMLDL